jgi:hypothetical protein
VGSLNNNNKTSNHLGHYGNNAADYIYSADNLVYTPWEKYFVILPVTSINNKRIWFKWAYTRIRKHKVEPPQFPVGSLTKRQWATWDEIVELKMRGLE